MPSPLFDQLHVVGDSMSDSGGIYQLSSQAISLAQADGINTDGLQPIPVSPPFAGKFSNGPVLPEITAQLLGAQLTISRSVAPKRSARRRSKKPPVRRFPTR